ncbi:thioredoxin domain-containing protein 12-like [Bradysia coprophila]|uniref:thioredoxin domain-containing protein 12-like n=1 Tax=Bradysia coprophila TaxID=38358 RepID=UPI00187D7B59|nr:thioredoxin domain-containing protein 12-like [Bradysia coprophila]
MKVITLTITLLMVAIHQVPSTLADVQNLAPVFNFTENIENAYQLAKRQSKPIVLVVHDTHCGACKSLRPSLIESHELRQLSRDVIMVQSLDGQDQVANAVNPDDNTYVPRIIFIGCNGKVFDSIFNVNQPKFKNYYTTAEDVIAGMEKAIEANKGISC